MRSAKFTALAVILTATTAANAQKAKRPAAPAAPTPVIFAVLSGGKTLEPIAKIEKKSLVELNVDGDAQKAFAAKYYKPKTSYGLIFGGGSAGSVSVGKANYPGECSGNSAETITTSKSANLSEMVMGLATNASLKLPASGMRRRPTPAERTEIEKLVRAEYTKQKVDASAIKTLRYQNLTALDVDGDGSAEFVGSYWVAASDTERDLLFFIARKSKAGEYELGHSEYSKVNSNDVMSGELSTLDKGMVGHELLLDVLDYDGDGTAEIFTIGKAFEGDNFYVYKLGDNGWKRVFETYNYRCAF